MRIMMYLILGFGGFYTAKRTVDDVMQGVERMVRISKPGSEEELAHLRKVEETAKAAASGGATGVLEVLGIPLWLLTMFRLRLPVETKQQGSWSSWSPGSSGPGREGEEKRSD